jgi:23S rRNA U2552 (ribose-2'-O)-methylase RlmE/FtsJ|tara:strand:+ start:567 stop:1160 length:594 start_codon:yes stop_codon:yes gene_type:complete
MASNIVDTTIDETYPVAGVDNDSQGFRDNFNIIKSNFVAAKAEITELQSNALLKNALSGDSLDNDLGGNEITNAVFKDCAEGISANGTINALQNISYLNGVYQTGTVTGDLTLTLADWPDAGYARMVVELESDASDNRAITFNGENTAQFKKLASDSWASTSATGVVATVTQSKEIYEFWTHDGGNTIYAKIVGTFT